jgi:hypothetical protein
MTRFPSSGAPSPYQSPQPDLKFPDQSPPKPASVLATVSVIAGLFSLLAVCFVCCCGILIIPVMFAGSLTAVATGHLALAQFKRNPDQESGYDLALIGTIFGYIALVLVSLWTIAILIGAWFSLRN